MSLPEPPSISDIQSRLNLVFPEGTQSRQFLIREMAARVVFVMLYIRAVEGEDRWLGPKHVYGMTDVQAELTDELNRLAYGEDGWKPGFSAPGKKWFADTTREPIRDETIREGLVRVGAIIQRTGIPTSSSKPRYALQIDFAQLFDPLLDFQAFLAAASQWQNRYLNALTLARLAVLRRGGAAMAGAVTVTLPNGALRQLAPGPSSIISKAVIEVFAKTYLIDPALILLSESSNKIIDQDESLASSISLKIEPDKVLPDIILIDLAVGKERLVFVEVVATDGPISESRKQALLNIAEDAHIPANRIAFVTAYLDRGRAEFRRTFAAIAWNTFVWFASDPQFLVILRERPDEGVDRVFDLT